MRLEKTAIVDEIRTEVNGSSFLLVAEYRGMKVEQLNDLRSQLRKLGSRMLVVKNRLLKHVAAERGWTEVAPALRGQSAMVTGKDIVQTAKILRRFRGTGAAPAIKAGMMDGRSLTLAQVEMLADLPSREVLLSQVVGTIAAPLSRLVGVMHQKLASLIYVLRAAEDKQKSTP